MLPQNPTGAANGRTRIPPGRSPRKGRRGTEARRADHRGSTRQLGVGRISPILPSNSTLRRAYENGAYHSTSFPFATTQTAPGHASLTTGVTPAVHGIIGNAIFDPEHGTLMTVDDRKHAVIGNPRRFVSPTSLQAPTVADVLHQHSGGEARIVGISMKG
ncbi:MAG: alkaline phosphatase family protein, partial [Myxococcales bacterium]|nr:alkaline phosphatase family protein [Myxococcales bacterium]